ncbi:MAG: hypothetical protein M0R33_17345 [Methylomonas sp.]|jgi:hypothetical protein|uniref:hypothetical protein n=1 Tax=Methylomonas sp. TaxID=418 RepID=UPI0025F43214|nr:hypothetical protein [Methylomonas sp.]MCK9608213.1 hypothetical protein [Methylomonas sp.]
MKPAQFQIVYDGPALEHHEMNVNDLAPALLAIGVLMEEVGNVMHGDKFKIGVSVKGSFKTGCFGIEMVASAKSLILDAIDIFNHGNTSAVLNAAGIVGLIKGSHNSLIVALRWLKNRKITKTEALNDGRIRVFIDYDHLDTEQLTLKLLQNYKIRKAFEDMIAKPLQRDGIESVAVVDPGEAETPVVLIEKTEAGYFITPELGEEKINDQTTVVNLQIASAAFVDGNKWRFSDGTQSFFAEILDEDFLNRVNSNEEAFAKSDILKVKMRICQWLTPKGMRAEYSVLEVLEHRSAMKQIDLFKH